MTGDAGCLLSLTTTINSKHCRGFQLFFFHAAREQDLREFKGVNGEVRKGWVWNLKSTVRTSLKYRD